MRDPFLLPTREEFVLSVGFTDFLPGPHAWGGRV